MLLTNFHNDNQLWCVVSYMLCTNWWTLIEILKRKRLWYYSPYTSCLKKIFIGTNIIETLLSKTRISYRYKWTENSAFFLYILKSLLTNIKISFFKYKASILSTLCVHSRSISLQTADFESKIALFPFKFLEIRVVNFVRVCV